MQDLWYTIKVYKTNKIGAKNMPLSYKMRWHLLIEKYKKGDLTKVVGIIYNIVARMRKTPM